MRNGRRTSTEAFSFRIETARHAKAEVANYGDSEQKKSDIRNIHCCFWARFWEGERDKHQVVAGEILSKTKQTCVFVKLIWVFEAWGTETDIHVVVDFWSFLTFEAFWLWTETDRHVACQRVFRIFEGFKTERKRYDAVRLRLRQSRTDISSTVVCHEYLTCSEQEKTAISCSSCHLEAS